MNKKFIPIAIVILVAIIAGTLFLASRMLGNKESTPEQAPIKKKISLPVNTISISERPIVFISPKADGHNIVINLESINKEAQEVEYEIEYQSGSLIQGASNTLDLKSLPLTENIFMGSCSAGGACTYHEDVKGGSLQMNFLGGAEPYAVKSDWKYIDNKAKETEISSRDAKFQLSSKDLMNNRYLIIFNSYGLPEGLSGTLVSNAYSLSSSNDLKGTLDIIIRANEDGGTIIMGWDGEWKEIPTQAEGRTLKASKAPIMKIYAAVKR